MVTFGGAPQYWLAGDPFRTRFFDAFSTILPIGERLFIDSVRRCQGSIRDERLREEVQAFIQQEAAHSREHRRFNGTLERRGFDLEPLDQSQRRVTARLLRFHSPLIPLSATVAMEHITAIMGAATLRGDLLKGAAPDLWGLWQWHAAEEIEHKAVAFDVYHELGGGPGLRRAMMAYGTFIIGIRVGARTARLLAHDQRLFDRRVWASAARFAFAKDGLIRTLGPDFLDFFRRDFHPWDHDNHSLVKEWRSARGDATPPAFSLKPRPLVPPTPHRTGKVFEILDELGENPLMGAEVWNTETGARQHRAEFHHKDVDGYGAMRRLLADYGVAHVPPPLRPERMPPPLFVRARAVLAVLRQKLRLEGVRWLVGNPAWKTGNRVIARAKAGRILTLEQTKQVREAARRAGVSVNSYLLHALNRSVTPLVAETSGKSRWGVPVNMRGPVRVEPELANASSIVSVEIADGASAKDVQATMKDILSRKLDWGKWDQVNLMMRLGESTARRQVREYYGNHAHPARMGVFSNLGVWSGELPPQAGFLVFGPSTAVDPLFATAVTWNGRLSIALAAHPSISESPSEVDRWVASWLGALLPDGADGSFARPVHA
jgi:predicted metal-dependent hydrolase